MSWGREMCFEGGGSLACVSFFLRVVGLMEKFPKKMGSWKVLGPQYQFLGDSNKQQTYGDF